MKMERHFLFYKVSFTPQCSMKMERWRTQAAFSDLCKGRWCWAGWRWGRWLWRRPRVVVRTGHLDGHAIDLNDARAPGAVDVRMCDVWFDGGSAIRGQPYHHCLEQLRLLCGKVVVLAWVCGNVEEAGRRLVLLAREPSREVGGWWRALHSKPGHVLLRHAVPESQIIPVGSAIWKRNEPYGLTHSANTEVVRCGGDGSR